jgi:amino acid transporter
MSFDSNLALLTNILFGLMGLEMVATHGSEMKNPAKDYAKGVFISAVIILLTIVVSSLAIASVVPESDLNLATGVMQAFLFFFESLNAPWAINLLAIAVILGGISGVSAWIIGPSKGIMVASGDGSLPKFLAKKNKHGVPANVLLIQAILVTIISLLFILLPTVNSSYWFLSAITAQLSILVYVILFIAAIRLHYKKREVKRYYTIPGKKVGIWLVTSLGIVTCCVVFLLGFIPPKLIPDDMTAHYVYMLLAGILLITCIPFLFLRYLKNRNI